MTDNQSAYHVSAILLEEGDWWSAQCLEYNIATQAKSLSDLLYELQRVLISHLSVAEELGRRPFEGLEPAPQKYWDMYEKAYARIETDDSPFPLPHSVAFPPVAPRLKIADSREVFVS